MNMPFLTMQALLGTDKRPPELPADDSEPGRLTQAIAATPRVRRQGRRHRRIAPSPFQRLRPYAP